MRRTILTLAPTLMLAFAGGPTLAMPRVQLTATGSVVMRSADLDEAPAPYRRRARPYRVRPSTQYWQPWAYGYCNSYPRWEHMQRRYSGSYPRPSYYYPIHPNQVCDDRRWW
jgi:hypothetical protein